MGALDNQLHAHLLGHEIHRRQVGFQAHVRIGADRLEPLEARQQLLGDEGRDDRDGQHAAYRPLFEPLQPRGQKFVA